MRLARSDGGLPLHHIRKKVWNDSGRRVYYTTCYYIKNSSKLMRCILLLILLSGTYLVFSNHGDDGIQNEVVIVEPHKEPTKIEPQELDFVDDNIVKSKTKTSFDGPTNDRQKAVVKAFQHAWKGYKDYAWGHDQLKPISKTFSDWFDTGMTIVDGIDTAIIMGLEKETAEATEWIRDKLTFEKNRNVNFFECTIRVLGGLLSAFHLTGDEMFQEKATDLGDRLLSAFKTSSPIPFSDVNLQKRTSTNPQWGSDSSLSEVTTVQLEFRDLSRITKNSTYEKLAFKVSEHIHKIGCDEHDGLCGMFINANTGTFKKSTTITFGARSDSYYEYLFKQWLQTGKTIDWLKNDYGKAMNSMEKLLYRASEPNKMYFVGELLSGDTYSPKMDHLVCFIAGTLALGSQNGFSEHHLEMAKKIGETCHNMYNNPTGLGPEIAHFNMVGGEKDLYVKPLDAHCLLRPEAIEAWFYLYRITGDKKYQEWGWSAFQAIETYARIPTGGYSSVSNVKKLKVQYKDMMESFYLAETLKYLYLLLADDQTILPLDQWVFNTEGHPGMSDKLAEEKPKTLMDIPIEIKCAILHLVDKKSKLRFAHCSKFCRELVFTLPTYNVRLFYSNTIGSDAVLVGFKHSWCKPPIADCDYHIRMYDYYFKLTTEENKTIVRYMHKSREISKHEVDEPNKEVYLAKKIMNKMIDENRDHLRCLTFNARHNDQCDFEFEPLDKLDFLLYWKLH
ncbi:unnamed protein product [Caenorhabditis angaria]|uniref:alpha-1,2-Mannosidase n=1 Tax=Caenorhabditis angaria TaxID=860376 RepID=A0A9P1N8V5_9PELO|nr:unnamed protein product [Caenorhabditis angaria]